jgi:haloacetate dehalogenase
MFEGFERRRIATSGAEIHVVAGGSGPPLLLVHGYPQTHVMWHRIAARLARSFRVIAVDMRGYGESSKPPAGADLSGYSKRVMARDLVEVMEKLGHERFGVAGHDRGARVAYRMALDHPARVARLAVLDIEPTLDTWEGLAGRAGLFAYHWYFLAQSAPFPETLIAPNAETFLRHTIRSWAGRPDALGEEAMRAYAEAFTPDAIRASCDDYRAGAHVDPEIDRADRDAGRRIACPVLVLWGDAHRRRPSLLATWRRWAHDVRGRALDCGHFLAEEAPDETAAELVAFFGAESAGAGGAAQ